eukprot:2723017-Prymnesium_polylepis.1
MNVKTTDILNEAWHSFADRMDAERVGDGNRFVDADAHELAEVHVDAGTTDVSFTLDATSDAENSSMLYATVVAALVGFLGIVLSVLLFRRSNLKAAENMEACLLYTSPSPRDAHES